MGLGPERKDSKTFGTRVYGLTHPKPCTLDEKYHFRLLCQLIFIKLQVLLEFHFAKSKQDLSIIVTMRLYFVYCK